MHAYQKWTSALLLSAGLAMGSSASLAVDDGGHSAGGHSDGHTSGGKGKGPKYMGGDRGTSHSSSSHKGGSSHHDSTGGGSKSLEGKIFHGKGSSGEKGDDHGEDGTTHSH